MKPNGEGLSVEKKQEVERGEKIVRLDSAHNYSQTHAQMCICTRQLHCFVLLRFSMHLLAGK